MSLSLRDEASSAADDTAENLTTTCSVCAMQRGAVMYECHVKSAAVRAPARISGCQRVDMWTA